MRARLYDFFPIATARIHEAIPAFPVVPAVSAGTFAVNNMVIIAVLLGAVPFLYERRKGAVALAWVVACVEILNGIGHLAGAILFRGYVPGAVTAPLLILAGVWLIRALRGLRS